MYVMSSVCTRCRRSTKDKTVFFYNDLPYCRRCCPWDDFGHLPHYHYVNALNKFEWDELDTSEMSLIDLIKRIGGFVLKHVFLTKSDG